MRGHSEDGPKPRTMPDASSTRVLRVLHHGRVLRHGPEHTHPPEELVSLKEDPGGDRVVAVLAPAPGQRVSDTGCHLPDSHCFTFTLQVPHRGLSCGRRHRRHTRKGTLGNTIEPNQGDAWHDKATCGTRCKNSEKPAPKRGGPYGWWWRVVKGHPSPW